jgi:hypothetical protein
MMRRSAAGNPPPLTVYTTRHGPAGGVLGVGLELAFGFTWDPSHGIPQPVVHLGGQDISTYVALTVNDAHDLTLAIDLTTVADVVCADQTPLYLMASAVFAPDGRGFAGGLTRVCSGTVSEQWLGSTNAAGAAWLVSMWQFTLLREADMRRAMTLKPAKTQNLNHTGALKC